MAYRGRGRGRGGQGGFAKQEPFVSFPEGVVLPDIKAVTVEENLVRQSLKLEKFWKTSPYYLEDYASKKAKNIDIERYSDKNKDEKVVQRVWLSQILEHKRFPAELTAGSKVWQKPSRKRVRWNHDSDLKKLDMFEKLEERLGTEEKEEKEKKEGEEDEEDDDQESEDLEDELSDDDYYQNQDFDDDEDDFNIEDDGDDAIY